MLPQIRIKDAWLLRENASKYLHELWATEKDVLADDEWMERRVQEYGAAWEPHEHKIVNGVCNTIDLTYRQNIIDVYVAPWFNAFSDPLVMGIMQEPDIFIDTLTHELIHRLLTDNTSIPYQTNILKPAWEKLFGKNNTFGVLVHIPVHAIHKAIYLDVLCQPYRLERDIKANTEYKATDYIAAWDYVENNGYKEIITKLKQSYMELAASSSKEPRR